MTQTFHNPDRFMADLRQILSQGRKRIGFLVGAGAPQALRIDAAGNLVPNGQALIPGVDELTKQVLGGLDELHRPAAEAIFNELGENANIESLLSRVRLLQEALNDTTMYGLNGSGFGELSNQICAAIGARVSANLPLQRNAYSELTAWIGGTNRPHAIEIFTTNYDLLFEEAFERAHISYFDGFSGGFCPFFDPVSVAGNDLPARWARLWKLHGSLGWAMDGGNVVRGRGRTATQLVYPNHLKYDLTQKQPYSALFERLKQFLLSPDSLLLAIGFSFRDAHVCAVLDEAMAMNANTAVLAFQYQPLDAEEPACKLAYDRPNLSVYAADGAVISGVKGAWRPGELPKNWESIRPTFWGKRSEEQDIFLLGDFARFARFCALSQAIDVGNPMEVGSPEATPAGTGS